MLDPDFILFAVTEKHSQIEVSDQACQTFIYQPGVAGSRRSDKKAAAYQQIKKTGAIICKPLTTHGLWRRDARMQKDKLLICKSGAIYDCKIKEDG